MNRKWMKYSGVFAAALTLVVAACDNLSESQLTGPGDADDVLLTWETSSGYKIARETDATVGIVTARIDENGGVLSIGAHILSVPAGAVTSPTTFVMTKLPGSIKVGLTATRLLPNDVGRAGFKKPVYLSLSYSDANITNEDQLKVVWVKADGTVEVQPSTVDSDANRVSSYLNHFSDYAVGWASRESSMSSDW